MKKPLATLPLFLAACAVALCGPLPGTRAAADPKPEEAVTLSVTPEREYLCRHGSRDLVLELELRAKHPDQSRHTPVNVSVVLDRSGSMEGPKIEKARQAACAALDGLDADDFFSLVIFDQEVEFLLPPERAGSREHRDELKARINRVAVAGHAKDAAALLRQRAAANSAAPASQQMPGYATENRKLDNIADELMQNGNLQNTSRKAAQWDNYQDKYQRKSRNE